MLCCSLILSIAPAIAQYGYDTATVYFEIGKSKLEKNSIQTLDSLSDYLKENKNRILIYGYADYLGAEKLSDRLSENRAQVVEQFLLKNKVAKSQIYQTTGVGQITIRGEESHGNQTYRRVDVFVKRTADVGNESNEVIAEPNDSSSSYKSDTKDFATTTSKTNPLNIQTTDFKKIKVNDVILLKNIQFYTSRSTIVATSTKDLYELIQIMHDYPSLKIRLEGHVCCVQDYYDAYDFDEGNSRLSINRARKIYYYLIQNGIDKDRLEYKGFGNSQPLISPEMSEADAQQNRRVEVRILSL